jgi:hypothetical protein
MGLRPTQADEKQLPFSNYSPWKRHLSPLSSRPERTRISYFAALATTTDAVSRKGNRMKMIKATALDRKSGGSAVEGPAVQRFFRGNVFRQRPRRPQKGHNDWSPHTGWTNPFPSLEPGVRGLLNGSQRQPSP